jgi:hypothetical protein
MARCYNSNLVVLACRNPASILAGWGPLARKRKGPSPRTSRIGAPAHGVENANTWWKLLIPQTPLFPTLMETREPGTCTKFNVLGSKR